MYLYIYVYDIILHTKPISQFRVGAQPSVLYEVNFFFSFSKKAGRHFFLR